MVLLGGVKFPLEAAGHQLGHYLTAQEGSVLRAVRQWLEADGHSLGGGEEEDPAIGTIVLLGGQGRLHAPLLLDVIGAQLAAEPSLDYRDVAARPGPKRIEMLD